MKTIVREEYTDNGNLWYRCHKTEDGKLHGLDESYYSDGSMMGLRYFNNGKRIKLENDYWRGINKIYISYYI